MPFLCAAPLFLSHPAVLFWGPLWLPFHGGICARLCLSPPRLQLARRSVLSSEPLSFKRSPVHWNELSLLQLLLVLRLNLRLLLQLLLLLLPGGPVRARLLRALYRVTRWPTLGPQGVLARSL